MRFNRAKKKMSRRRLSRRFFTEDPACSRQKSPSGSSLVELAFLTTTLCVLMLGAFDVGRLAYYSIIVNHASRAGVQYGAQNLAVAMDNTSMQNSAKNDAGNLTGLTATASHYCKCANGGTSTCAPTDCSGSQIVEFVKVTTTYTVQPFMTFPGLPGPYTLSGSAVMRVEQ